MPLSEYTDSIGGGLKLKGIKDGRVKKHKKKKSLKDTPAKNTSVEDTPAKDTLAEDNITDEVQDRTEVLSEGEEEAKKGIEPAQDKEIPQNRYGKTEAQLRHEERRRQLMEERDKREGVKTHKEKVEELNKYLSRLSEHHDMPRIGPG